MPQPQRQEIWQPPAIPAETVQEGSRWRHAAPSSAQVAEWFKTQPLDEEMEHDDYIAGIVLIPQSGKAYHRAPDGRRVERFEDTWTPYVQVGTRIAYFHNLAAKRDLISVIEPADVPQIDDRQSAFYNGNMERGYWWHIVRGEGDHPVRYLCCTMRVALFERATYLAGERDNPLLNGRSTKQIGGGPDPNQLAKAQTSAIGRALGVAGILVIGTGVATAEDMQELAGAPGGIPGPETAQVPSQSAPEAAPTDPAEQASQLRVEIAEMQSTMQVEAPHGWTRFAAWWRERAAEEGWQDLSHVPVEGLRAVLAQMQRMHGDALTHPPEGDANAAGGETANEQTEVGA